MENVGRQWNSITGEKLLIFIIFMKYQRKAVEIFSTAFFKIKIRQY